MRILLIKSTCLLAGAALSTIHIQASRSYTAKTCDFSEYAGGAYDEVAFERSVVNVGPFAIDKWFD